MGDQGQQNTSSEIQPSTEHLHPAEAAARQRAFIIKIVRAVFAVLVATFTALSIWRVLDSSENPATAFTALGLPASTWIIGGATLLIVAFVLMVDRVTRYNKISTISGVILGALAGLLATLAMGGLIDLLLKSWVPEESAFNAIKPILFSIKIVMGISLTYLGVITVLQTQDDFRLVIPYVEFSKQIRGIRPILLDTSALIDGRIVEIAGANFIQSPLVVPRCVIQELQTLADSQDAMKRSKGRRGLDVIGKLQRLATIDLSIDETVVPGQAVDQMLVELARPSGALIATTDVALSRVAAIHNVGVMNIHELANATRPSLVPGELVTLKLVKLGEQHGQGVGYLPDGTMVVAEDGAARVGEVVTMTVSSSLQTSAGRLIFARIGEVRDVRSPELGGEYRPEHRAPSPVPAPLLNAPLAGDGAQPEQRADGPTGGFTPISPSEAMREGSDAGASDAAAPRAARSPFPPKPPASIRAGTPRNPRR
jgi:uncharacterized protein YacL